jgi:hypothetical protein
VTKIAKDARMSKLDLDAIPQANGIQSRKDGRRFD